MWEAIKNALSGVKDATGIEIPGLPADLGSIGESANNALGSVTETFSGGLGGLSESATAATESVTGGLEGLGGLSESATAATESVTGGLGGVGEAATAAVDSAAQGLPDVAGGLIGGAPEK